MATLHIIFSGLIVFVPIYEKIVDDPDLTKTKVLAVLIQDANHKPMIYHDCKKYPRKNKDLAECTSRAFPVVQLTVKNASSGLNLDSSGLFDKKLLKNTPPEPPSRLVVLDLMGKKGVSPTPGDLDPEQAKLTPGGKAAARVLLTEDKIGAETKLDPPFSMWGAADLGHEVYKGPVKLADLVTYTLTLAADQAPTIELSDGTSFQPTKADDNNWYVVITNHPPKEHTCQGGPTDEIPHFSLLYSLSKGDISGPTPKSDNGCKWCCKWPCKKCKPPEGPSGYLIRCPAAVLNPVTTVPPLSKRANDEPNAVFPA